MSKLGLIVRRYYTSYSRTRKLPWHQQHAALQISRCRTAQLGGHVNSCPEGHFHRVAYNSCRHRCCPQCQWRATEIWLAGWQQRLLPCPHHHIVFTVAHQLIPLWRHNRRVFADLLFRAASQTLKELLLDPKYLGGRVGIMAALHTWNQSLKPHVHLHCLVTSGGVNKDGCWSPPKRACLLPAKVLMIKFRGKLKAIIRHAAREGTLELPTGQTLDSLEQLLKDVTRIPWNLRIYPAYRDGRSVAVYLARYLRGGPIGNYRIKHCHGSDVTIAYRLPRNRGGDGKRQALLPLPVDKFMARWLEHVPPKRLQTVRGYGLYCGNQYSQLESAQQLLGVQQTELQLPTTWQQWCELSGHSGCRCPVCGAMLISHHPFPAHDKTPGIGQQRPPPVRNRLEKYQRAGGS